MTTDVGRKFLNLVDSCFPPSNPLHKIFNRNAGECALGGECLAECIVYKAEVKVKVPRGVVEVEDAPGMTYLGVVEPEWKERKGNHNADFKHSSKRGNTCLSKHIYGA